MRIGIIGNGAIGTYVRETLIENGCAPRALIELPEVVESCASELPGIACVATVADLPAGIDHMVDCAGHSALKSHGPDILRRGIDLTTVSIAGFADEGLSRSLDQAAIEGKAKLHLASGAIGALDALRAASVGNLQSVTYIGRKPPQAWIDSPAESRLNLDELRAAAIHFEGSARDAAIEYPKNANVAAAVALAGIGFDKTQVRLIADPNVIENIHRIEASGDFGRFMFEIRGSALPDNPKSSALAAMSVISKLEQQTQNICF